MPGRYVDGTQFVVRKDDDFVDICRCAEVGDVLEVLSYDDRRGYYVCMNVTNTRVKTGVCVFHDDIGDSVVLHNSIDDYCDTMTFVIEDQRRLEELTEWCRNKPEEAAVRIMTAEKLGGEL